MQKKKNTSHHRSTDSDSPLELLQENSDVHAPLGVKDGNLGDGKDTNQDTISLSVAKITSLLG